MTQSIKKTVFSLLALLMLVSCNTKETLQTYFVDHQETPNFTSVDIPTSIVKFDKAKLDKNQLDAYSSVKRLNFLGYKVAESNIEDYKTELTKIKQLLKDKKYEDLMEFNDKGGKVIIKYIGTDEAADEFIVFGSSSDLGFGILRVLGNDMDAQKLMTLAESMKKADIDNSQLSGIVDFFK